MERVKKALPAMALSFLFIVVFNVLAFILTDTFDGNFWCGYIFTTLAWLCLIGIELITANKSDGGRALFLNAPGILVTLIHLAVQLILGIAVMAIPFLSVKIAICFEIVIFAVYLGLVGVLEIYKNKNMR